MRYLFDYLKMANMVNLVDGDQFYLVPYNPGGHWVLKIVRPAKEIVYYMESLRNRSVDEEMRNIVNTSIKMYNSHTGKQSSHKSPILKKALLDNQQM
ncbi:hypothetical protein L3X38_003536 [Prunus dulcis]|uniref:Ubiquitin-like protease family profile domain-containing protein n=1 Tax=Prunus dulcis TaxID=3755 RepID=A0AAD5F2A5_PRUDU|nr:hypothetical protein L3X38_003536 [Prunus dulcis]